MWYGGRFSTQDTCPGARPWVDAIQMLDGHWAPDGTSLAVTDVAGQLHVYGLGGPDGLRCAAPPHSAVGPSALRSCLRLPHLWPLQTGIRLCRDRWQALWPSVGGPGEQATD